MFQARQFAVALLASSALSLHQANNSTESILEDNASEFTPGAYYEEPMYNGPQIPRIPDPVLPEGFDEAGIIASPVNQFEKYPPGKWGDPRYDVDGYDLGPIVYSCDPETTDYQYCCTRYAVFDYKLESPAYQYQSATCKLQILWDNLRKSLLQNFWPMGKQMIKHFKQNQNVSFDYVADSMFSNRVKYIHPAGTVAVIEFEPTYDHPYTGVYESGCTGIIRVSDVVVGINRIMPLTPSFAWKCLIDYRPSINFFAAVHSDGTGADWNFFGSHFASSVPGSKRECTNESNDLHALEATQYVTTTSVYDAGRWDRYGREAQYVNSPVILYYEPIFNDIWPFPFHGDWTLDIMALPAGVRLVTVYGCDAPKEMDGVCYKVGYIRQKTEQITSEWGDNGLFFQHYRFERDVEVRPHVKDFFPKLEGKMPLSVTGVTEFYPEGEPGCPWSFLFETARDFAGLAHPWEMTQ